MCFLDTNNIGGHGLVGVGGGGGVGGMGMRRLSLNPPPQPPQQYSFFDNAIVKASPSSASSSGGDMMFKASPTIPLKSLSSDPATVTTIATAITSMGCNTGCFPPSLQVSSSSGGGAVPQEEPSTMIPSGSVIDDMEPVLKLKEHKRRPPSSYKSNPSSSSRDGGDSSKLVSFPATYTLSSKDIMCGRHKRAMNHPGNRRFRAFIASYLPRYFEFPTRIDRAILALDIVEALDESGGYFLKQNKQTGVWTELSSKEKRDKVGHALRDAAASAAASNNASSSNGSVSSHASSTAIKKQQQTKNNNKTKVTTSLTTTTKRRPRNKMANSAPNLGELMGGDIPVTVQTAADDTQSVPDSHTVSKQATTSSRWIPEFTPSGGGGGGGGSGLGLELSEDDDENDELSSIDDLGIETMKDHQSSTNNDLVDMDVFIDPFNTDEPEESEAIAPSSTTAAAQQQHTIPTTPTTATLSHLLQADFLEF